MKNSGFSLNRIAILIPALVCVLSACATPYYGYTKSRWQTLSDAEKAAAKAEYQQVIDAKNNQRHDALLEAREQQVLKKGRGAHGASLVDTHYVK